MSTARRRTVRTRNQFPFQLLHIIPEEITIHECLHKFTLRQQQFTHITALNQQINAIAFELKVQTRNLVSVVEFAAVENQLGLLQWIDSELQNDASRNGKRNTNN